jgi:hypothetical protein
LALALQGIVGRLATDGHQGGHRFFMPLDYKSLAGCGTFQQLGQTTARFFDAQGGVMHGGA